jgi:hypothetical protein
MTEMRDKIARAIEDNLKSQGIRIVIDIAAQPDVRHICDGMLSLGALADAILALIEPVMEENEIIECLGALLAIAASVVEMGNPDYERAGALYERLTARAALSPKSEKRDG